MPEQIVESARANEAVQPVQRRDVAAALVLFWLAFVGMYTLRAALLGTDHQAESLVRRAAVATVGISLSWLMYCILERAAASSLRKKILLTAVMSFPAGAGFATVNVLVFYVIAPMPSADCQMDTPCINHQVLVAISDLLISWSFVFLAWGMLCLSLASAAAARLADARASAHRAAARVAEIRALRYQINPHFFFNVLNSLMTLVRRRDVTEAEVMIAQIGRFMRYSLAADPCADAVLADEVAIQMGYLELEKRRFSERLLVQVDMSNKAAAALVPSLLLQPLIENAVKHGLSCSVEPVLIQIQARDLPDGRLEIVIEDDALTMPPRADAATSAGDGRAAKGMGIGLKNVAERLALHFDGSATCAAGPLSPRGFRVTLLLPLVLR
jgi:two-component system LytT family sensor kinase